MAIELKQTGTECHEVYKDDRVVARVVPHNRGTGWKLVDLKGNALDPRSYGTPELAIRYLPADLLRRVDGR
jgi:hypothetical protein